jgi:nitrate reductase (cytochrome), electron transfer subunit
MEKEMKKSILTMLVAMVTLAFAGAAFSGAQSLRLGQPIDDGAKAPAKAKIIVKQGGIERSYNIQPPAIPHKVDKEQINLKVNTCMKCHSAETYKKEKAPQAGKDGSHYLDRDGKKTAKVAARRYFCDQCHAPQVDKAPLVENTFQGAK